MEKSKKYFLSEDSQLDSDSAPFAVSANAWVNAENVRTKSTDKGVTGTVVDKGSVIHLVQYLMQSMLHSLQELGCRSIQELHKGIYEGTLRFEMRSPSAQAEGTVHSLYSFKEPHLGLLRGR